MPRYLAETASDEPVREAGAMTDDLNALAQWLAELGVDAVAVESTAYARFS
jgi:transposase